MAADEVVALYDEAGEVVGSAPRSVMRARNLRHAASSVVVRDPLGRIYLHRRTETKDVYPGLLDFAAGGVVLAGEDPAAGAVREVEEELGVVGVPLEPLGVADYADEHTSYRAVRFVVTWAGPIRWQPEEVSWASGSRSKSSCGAWTRRPRPWCPTASPCGRRRCGRGTRAGPEGRPASTWRPPPRSTSGLTVPRTGPGQSPARQPLLRCADGLHR